MPKGAKGDRAVPVPTDIRGRGRQGAGIPARFPTAGGSAPPRPAQQGAAMAQLSRTIPPPFQVRPPQARDITVEASATGYNNLNTPQVIAGSQFQVPTDNVGVLRSVVLSVNNLLTTSALIWAIRFNGVPVQGWNQLTVFPRNAGSVSIAYTPDETYIYVPDGALIDTQITVSPADGNTYQAGIAYHGWYYDKRLADAFAGLYM